MTLRAFSQQACLALVIASSGPTFAAGSGDTVLHWNEIAQQVLVKDNPNIQSRSMAITEMAVLDAMLKASTVAGASPDVAAMAATHDVLAALHPEATQALDVALSKGLAAVNSKPDDAALAIAHKAAADILQRRKDDGWNAEVDYIVGREPGAWVPTPPQFLAPQGTQWGQIRPFILRSGGQFRPEPPAAHDSSRYLSELEEVADVGAASRAARSPDKTAAAQFWISSAVQEWNLAARHVAASKWQSGLDKAQTLAALNVAIADALIACFDAKYTYKRWRPVSAIQAGIGARSAQPDWLPLITTPAFPAYPSAHACAAGAAQAVLERRFGPEGHDIMLTSPTAPDVIFRFSSFAAISDQIDDARVYGGIHTREDQAVGRALGKKVSFGVEN